jgi:hypothetical protein
MTALPHLAMRRAFLAYKRTTSAVRAARGCDEFSEPKIDAVVGEAEIINWVAAYANEHAKPLPMDY